FFIGIVLFTLAAAGCALATNTGWLIAMRAVQGIGAALMVPGSLAIVAKAYPKSERGKAIGIWAAASSAMLVVGPLIGGVVISATGDWGWRLLFAINVPLGAAVTAMLWLKVPRDPAGEHRHFDLVGGMLVSLALFLIAFGLTGQASMGSTPAGQQLALFVGAGMATLAAFVVWEARSAAPMMPVTLFRNRSFSGANAVTFLTDFAVSANLFFLPMAVITGWGETAAAVSVLFLPMPILLSVISEPAGQLADRFGPAPLITLGCGVLAASCAGLALGFAAHDLWTVVLPLMVLMAVGQSLIVAPLSTAVMTSEDDADIIVASGVNNAISRTAWLVAVAAMGGVAAMVFGAELAGTPAEATGLSFGLPADAALVASVEAVRVVASDTAFAAIAWVTAGLAALAALIAGFTLPWTLGRPVPAAG
ncbi:MAG TPA: MFS transporter, partial [Devosiaceae bacterium]|nr:MFS transporter [Devosiaceae bacterium]